MKTSMQRQAYPTDLIDEQWTLIQPHISVNRGPDRPTTVDVREVVNTLLYMNRMGCQ
ncbi:MAG: hypothetical protein KatS3mg057_0390 [Herpetosiphonaceae bacterium]|nr:MAG: hypothetical protein KatS3mg057_0390 [Herpetosiphonaceae bacterium]